MKVVARRQHRFRHVVDIEEGAHHVVVDEPREAGGGDAGPAPTRLLAASLASCVAVTMELYAERKGWELGEVEVEVDVEYEGPVPSSFAVYIHLPAELSDDQRSRLLTIAGKCPVHRALAGETKVTVAARERPL